MNTDFEVNVTLVPESECVYLLNGSFFEGERIVVSQNSVLFVTVLPLNAQYLPFTVKLIGAKVVSNHALALSCKTGETEYVLKLGKRQYVYSATHDCLPSEAELRFFYLIKGKHLSLVGEMMSKSLRAGLSDAELLAFWDDYNDLIKVNGTCYAVDEAGVGHRCKFTFVENKIDDVSVE